MRLKSSLEAILEEAQKAADMTRHLLAFNHREYMKPKPIKLNKAIDRETDLLRRTLGEQITIEVEHEPALPLAMADPACLSQVILNLAVHARDSMPNGGRLTLGTRRLHIPNPMAAGLVHVDAKPGDYVVVSITDTGRGMKAEEVSRLFEPPEAPPPAGGNSGLGLVLVHGLVRHLGGWINVMSVPEVGTEFAVHLPAASSDKEEAAPQADKGLLDDVSQMGPSTILIVDDEDSVRQVMEYVLTSQGHKVLTAKDANEGWALWRSYSHIIKLAILDIMLPGGSSGFDLGQAINDVDRTVPVVFTCGYCPTTLKQNKELEMGVNFLPKPFGMVELLNIVGQALLQPVRL
jgi:CheY-like chemotaxis protein